MNIANRTFYSLAIRYHRLKWRVNYWIWVKRGSRVKVLQPPQLMDELPMDLDSQRKRWIKAWKERQ